MQRSVVPPVPEGNFLLQVINVADGDVMLKIPGSDAFPDPVPRLQVTTTTTNTVYVKDNKKHQLIKVTFEYKRPI